MKKHCHGVKGLRAHDDGVGSTSSGVVNVAAEVGFNLRRPSLGNHLGQMIQVSTWQHTRVVNLLPGEDPFVAAQTVLKRAGSCFVSPDMKDHLHSWYHPFLRRLWSKRICFVALPTAKMFSPWEMRH